MAWAYRIGECVDHVLGGMLGWVRCMGETTAGRQVFAVVLMDEDDRPLRIMRSDFLVPVPEGSEKCRRCVNWSGNRCMRQAEMSVAAE